MRWKRLDYKTSARRAGISARQALYPHSIESIVATTVVLTFLGHEIGFVIRGSEHVTIFIVLSRWALEPFVRESPPLQEWVCADQWGHASWWTHHLEHCYRYLAKCFRISILSSMQQRHVRGQSTVTECLLPGALSTQGHGNDIDS